MNYYKKIKNELINNEITKKVKDAGKHYGEGIIKEYSKRLTNELGKGYTITRLKYMRRYYEVLGKCPTMSDILTYSHYCELIWFDDVNKMNYYIKISIEQNLSVRLYVERIINL